MNPAEIQNIYQYVSMQHQVTAPDQPICKRPGHNFSPTPRIYDKVVQVNCKIYLPVRTARHYNSISRWLTQYGWYMERTIRSWKHYYSTNKAG